MKLPQMVPRLSWVTWGMPRGPETLAGMAYGLLSGPESSVKVGEHSE